MQGKQISPQWTVSISCSQKCSVLYNKGLQSVSQKYELSISNSSRIVDGSLMMGCMNVNVMVICAFRILREIATKPLKGSCGFGLTVYLWHPQAQKYRMYFCLLDCVIKLQQHREETTQCYVSTCWTNIAGSVSLKLKTMFWYFSSWNHILTLQVPKQVGYVHGKNSVILALETFHIWANKMWWSLCKNITFYYKLNILPCLCRMIHFSELQILALFYYWFSWAPVIQA